MSEASIQKSHTCLAESLISTGSLLSAVDKPWEPISHRRLVVDLELCQLYVYPAINESKQSNLRPDDVVFIVYAMVNTASILDLTEQMSTIGRLQQQGLTVYLMEWKAPLAKHSTIGLFDYLSQSLNICVLEALKDCGLDTLNLLGVCQGGVFSLCYAAMFPERIRSVISMVTPVDFHTSNDTLSCWARYLDINELVQAEMNIPGQLLAQAFLMLKPMGLMVQKYLDIAENTEASAEDMLQLKGFLAMEQWIDTTPDHPAQVFKDFVIDFYQRNSLYRASLIADDKIIDLSRLTMPVLNVYAANDHLVPPESSMALKALIPGAQYQDLEVPTGHIGMFVSQKALNYVPEAIADFIRQV